MKRVSWQALLGALLIASFMGGKPGAEEAAPGYVVEQFARRTIYHSPQTPGYTCWVGLWSMPDGSLMVTFKQATGPIKGRPRDFELLKKLGMEREPPDRDFTGL